MTAEVVPRWEWRTFGDDFGEAERRFAAPERVRESDEVYVLSPATDASVKVRDELMDVKRLERVNDDGLEQWRPVLRAPLPLSPDQAAIFFDALGVTGPGRTEYTFDDLVTPELRAVPVHKRRAHTTIGGCMAELSEVRTEQAATRTIAVESEDPELVIATVRTLGLDSRPNVSMPRGLKALVG